MNDLPTDLAIACQASLKPLSDVAAEMGLPEALLEPYGEDVAKIKLDAIDAMAERPKAPDGVVSPRRA